MALKLVFRRRCSTNQGERLAFPNIEGHARRSHAAEADRQLIDQSATVEFRSSRGLARAGPRGCGRSTSAQR